MASKILIDGEKYFECSRLGIKEGDFLVLPEGGMLYVEKFDQVNGIAKASPITCAEGPIPIGSKIVKLTKYLSNF